MYRSAAAGHMVKMLEANRDWLALITDGYSASAASWPGDAPTVADALDDMGIEQMVNHYAELIGKPATKPIVIGHSFGGLIAQELLADDLAAAAVGIDPARIKGAIPLRLQKHPTEEESDALHAAWTTPGTRQALFKDAGANFSRHSPAKVDTHQAGRGPLLLTSGTEDHTLPLKVTKTSSQCIQRD